MLHKFFDKKIRSGANVNENLKEGKSIHGLKIINIWAADLAKIRSLSTKNWDVRYYMSYKFAPNRVGLSLCRVKKLEQLLMVVLK